MALFGKDVPVTSTGVPRPRDLGRELSDLQRKVSNLDSEYSSLSREIGYKYAEKDKLGPINNRMHHIQKQLDAIMEHLGVEVVEIPPVGAKWVCKQKEARG